MNERIKQLAVEAGMIVGEPNGFDMTRLMPKEVKFAELIVKECIDRASIGNGHGNNQWDRALTFASNSIKDHFGVEK